MQVSKTKSHSETKSSMTVNKKSTSEISESTNKCTDKPESEHENMYRCNYSFMCEYRYRYKHEHACNYKYRTIIVNENTNKSRSKGKDISITISNSLVNNVLKLHSCKYLILFQ